VSESSEDVLSDLFLISKPLFNSSLEIIIK
jgi:hypothetical protein